MKHTNVLHNIRYNLLYRAGAFVLFLFSGMLSGLMAQIPNPDISILIAHSAMAGTARSIGAGGAFSAVGGDLGAMDLNPASLGLYNTSDISVTPALRIAADRSAYDGTIGTKNSIIPLFAQGGGAFLIKMKHSGETRGSAALKSLTIAVNFQTENSFNREQSFNATNTGGSLVQNIVNYSNMYQFLNWSLEGQLMNASGLLGQNTATNKFYSNVLAPVYQNGGLSTTGSINNIGIGAGLNFNDKVYFGFGLNIPLLNYTVNTSFAETNANPNDTVTHFIGYQLASVVSEVGEGVSGKLGLIFRPVHWLRLGVAYTLPTWYFVAENYSSDLIYIFDTMQGPAEYSSGPPTQLNYQLRTPMKGTIGACFSLEKMGFISVDYEFQNLGSTNYHFTDYPALDSNYNNYLKSVYTFNHTVRAGIEGIVAKFMRLRAGYSYSTSPFKRGQNYADPHYDQVVQTASAGVGFVYKRFYLDFAYVFSYTRDALSPNFQIPLDNINSTLITHNVLLTVGFKLAGRSSNSGEAPKRHSDELPKHYIDPGDKY